MDAALAEGVIMFLVVVIVAVVGILAVAAAVLSATPVLAWFAIAAGVLGLVLMILDWMRLRRAANPDYPAVADSLLSIGRRYPDYGPSDRTPPDVLTHGDHAIERAIAREERVLQPDNGPGDLDISGFRANEAMVRRHSHAS